MFYCPVFGRIRTLAVNQIYKKRKKEREKKKRKDKIRVIKPHSGAHRCVSPSLFLFHSLAV